MDGISRDYAKQREAGDLVETHQRGLRAFPVFLFAFYFWWLPCFSGGVESLWVDFFLFSIQKKKCE